MAFDRSTADAICEQLASGKSLRSICRKKGMPAESTVRLWAIDDVDGFAAQYRRAREVQAHVLAEEMLDIANTAKLGSKTVIGPDGTTVTKSDMTEHRRMQIDARKWYISKVLPKIYGDKLQLDGDFNVKRSVAEMTDEELLSIARRNAPKS